MHKNELITGLKKLVTDHEATRWKGQESFARFLIWWLEKFSIPSDEKYDFFQIEPHLPELIVAAFEELRTGTDEEIVRFRVMYEGETGGEVPNITDLGEDSAIEQGLTVQIIGYMLQDVTGQEWVATRIDTYCNAQKYVLQQTMDKFLRKVYWNGLFTIVDESSSRGMSGTFGETELRTFITAGRIMFTFARKVDKKKSGAYEKDGVMYLNEHQVSFVGDDEDPLGLRAGLQSVYADFRTALDLIEDVIAHWPANTEQQKKVYKPSKNVSLA